MSSTPSQADFCVYVGTSDFVFKMYLIFMEYSDPVNNIFRTKEYFGLTEPTYPTKALVGICS